MQMQSKQMHERVPFLKAAARHQQSIPAAPRRTSRIVQHFLQCSHMLKKVLSRLSHIPQHPRMIQIWKILLVFKDKQRKTYTLNSCSLDMKYAPVCRRSALQRRRKDLRRKMECHDTFPGMKMKGPSLCAALTGRSSNAGPQSSEPF